MTAIEPQRSASARPGEDAPMTSPLGARKHMTLLVAVISLAVLLRLWGLWGFPFDQDELYTLRDAVGFGEGMSARPLYYFLQHLLLDIFPVTHFHLRLPAFIFGVLGVWATWRLGRAVFGVTAGIVAASLIAISPWHLYASGFARYWTLVYLLAAVTYWIMWRAVRTDELKLYLTVSGILAVGALTHPTFLFPLAGALPVMYLVDGRARLDLRKPSSASVLGLIFPMGILVAGAFVVLTATDSWSMLRNATGRGLDASLRLLPAIIQWGSPSLFAVAGLGTIGLYAWNQNADRRWTATVVAGAATGIGGLLVASFVTDVYADYAMAVLPLVFVTAGAIIQRIGERLADKGPWVSAGATLVLAAAVLPGTVSHLSSGTRFDYRPALSYIEDTDPQARVFGWPIALQKWYAPDLTHSELTMDPAQLSSALAEEGGFWVVTSHRRRGIAGDAVEVADWLDRHCHTMHTYERPRIDYRTYRVDVHWCE